MCWDRPWCQAGGALGSSPAAPAWHFQGQEELQGPLGHLGKQGSSGEESGSGVWDPLHSAQRDLVLFIL